MWWQHQRWWNSLCSLGFYDLLYTFSHIRDVLFIWVITLIRSTYLQGTQSLSAPYFVFLCTWRWMKIMTKIKTCSVWSPVSFEGFTCEKPSEEFLNTDQSVRKMTLISLSTPNWKSTFTTRVLLLSHVTCNVFCHRIPKERLPLFIWYLCWRS